MRRFSLDAFRTRLASVEALPQLVVLALFTGAATAVVSLAFRGAIQLIGIAWLPESNSENFEGLPAEWRLVLPLIGALLIGLALQLLRPIDRSVGVVHVMERLERHQGRLRLNNALTQFFGGIVALSTGASGGREGPAIHLGAATSSLLGQAFTLPNNSLRTLVGCGTAAAIACSFNTPLAGVILALEVVMMDYAITSFVPAIVAAVTATLIARLAYGDTPAFTVPPLALQSLAEIPYVVIAGLLCGGVAAFFIRSVRLFARLAAWPIAVRCTLAGAVTGTCALLVPEVMGIGYDTVNGALIGEVAIGTLALLVVFKVLATSACVGLGMPVGLIGPTLVIGAALGGILGQSGVLLFPELAASSGFYVMLGMCALMAATLQAPLAALIAVVELTANPHVVLPAMLIIVAATLTSSHVFRERSVFASLLDALGLRLSTSPITLHLQRAGVASLMQRAISRLPERVEREAAQAALENEPRWIVVESQRGRVRGILGASDLRRHLDEDESTPIELMEVPAARYDVASIDVQATLQEALQKLDHAGADALCVRKTVAPMIAPVVGVLTRDDIDRYAGAGT